MLQQSLVGESGKFRSMSVGESGKFHSMSVNLGSFVACRSVNLGNFIVRSFVTIPWYATLCTVFNRT